MLLDGLDDLELGIAEREVVEDGLHRYLGEVGLGRHAERDAKVAIVGGQFQAAPAKIEGETVVLERHFQGLVAAVVSAGAGLAGLFALVGVRHDVVFLRLGGGQLAVELERLVDLLDVAYRAQELVDAVLEVAVLQAVAAAPVELVVDAAEQHLARHGQQLLGRVGGIVDLDEGADLVALHVADVLQVALAEMAHVALQLVVDGAAVALGRDHVVVFVAGALGHVAVVRVEFLVDEQVAGGHHEGGHQQLDV